MSNSEIATQQQALDAMRLEISDFESHQCAEIFAEISPRCSVIIRHARDGESRDAVRYVSETHSASMNRYKREGENRDAIYELFIHS